jgi:hypothetical protein
MNPQFRQGAPQPLRAISIWFVDLQKFQIYKHYFEHNSGLTALLEGYFKPGDNVTVGDDGPARERANCEGSREL